MRENPRQKMRNLALQTALRKRSEGVPTYTVAEAAALLSVSQEYLYRLVQAGGFPAARMRIGGNQGRYVIPAKALEQVLDDAAESGDCVDVADWSQTHGQTGGAA